MSTIEDYEDERERERDRTPNYRALDEIGPTELRQGLQSLTLFNSDFNLRQQAFNLGLVDGAAMQLEAQLLQKYFNEEPYLEEAAFLNALSQMWIFAAYELLRTWRQKAGDMAKWAECGGLQAKLESLRKDTGFRHSGKELLASQIEGVISNPEVVDQIRLDLRKTHILFVQIEAIRISIAKHEVRKRPKSVAHMPTYGRINQWCGSLDYEISNDAVVLGEISRRNIADGLRAIPQADVPTEESIAGFEKFMRGPTQEELATLFQNPQQIDKPRL